MKSIADPSIQQQITSLARKRAYHRKTIADLEQLVYERQADIATERAGLAVAEREIAALLAALGLADEPSRERG